MILQNKESYEAIKEAIVTVPGVVSFANYAAKVEEEIKTNDIEKAVEVTNIDKLQRYKIHIVLMNGVNIRDVVSEVQIRVKYELEKLSKFTQNFIVDIAVDDLALM